MAEKIYFAWIDEAEAFNPLVHNRSDEDVFAGSIEHNEGDFAAASLEVRNPRIGLLNAGRKVWCFVSFDNGAGTITPIFKGRLIALPDDIFQEVVTFQFTARPTNFVFAKKTLADTLRVLPYWDPALISPDAWEDDDTVLEARSAHWFIDPVTHAISISDIIVAEDGVIDFAANEFLRDNMTVRIGQTPLRSCRVTATFPWLNSGDGVIDIGARILQEWPGKDPNYNLIWSYTFQGLSQSWPKPGSAIGSGWTVRAGELLDLSFLNVVHLPIPNYFDQGQIPASIAWGSIMFQPKISGRFWGGVDGAGFDENVQLVVAATGWGEPTLTVSYAGARDYSQVLDFTLSADVQNIVTDTGGDDYLEINLNSNPLTDLGWTGTPTIGKSERYYLNSDRGQLSLQHCILVARAHLCARARAITVGIQAPFKKCLGVSLRKGGLVHDSRLPGGQAAGKIMGWQLTFNGDRGEFLGNVTIGCAIGYGGSVSGAAGVFDYIDDDYIDPTYYEHINTISLVDTSDITYELPQIAFFDDNVDFHRGLNVRNAIEQLTVTNGPGDQAAALTAAIPGIGDQAKANSVLQSMPTTITLKLRPINTGPFSQGVSPTLSVLVIPKQIDLEAASSP